MERRSFEEELAEFKLELNQAHFECDRAKADRDKAEQERDDAQARSVANGKALARKRTGAKRMAVALEELVEACVVVTQEGWSYCVICNGDDVASVTGGLYTGAVAHEEGCAVKEAIVVILTPDEVPQ